MALAGGTTRIERRYEILGAAGATSPEIIETGEEIRPWTPDALLAVVAANGLLAERQWWDYDTASAGSVAQFFTVACRMPA
jgi:hypothetical protein